MSTRSDVEEEFKTSREKSAEVNIPIEQKLGNITERNKGIRIKAPDRYGVSVVAMSEEVTSADMFLVLPPVYLPDQYEYYAVSVEEVMDELDQLVHMSAFLIVASEDDTSIVVTLTRNVNISSAADISGSGNVGEPMFITLNEKDTLYITSLEDLSGSRVVANKPITFISGHECGNLPTDMKFCDQMFEQIPPTSTWGKKFYTAPLSSRQSFDHYKVVASENDTTVSSACSLPIVRMGAGDVISFNVPSERFCSFTSNKPVLLVQFAVATTVDNASADPFMMIIPPIEQYRDEYLVTTFRTKSFPEKYFVNIVIEAEFDRELVLLNGFNIAETWTEIPCEGDEPRTCAYGVQVNVNVSDGALLLSHKFPNVPFGVTVYSFGIRVGQGYVAGLNQKPVACKCRIL